MARTETLNFYFICPPDSYRRYETNTEFKHTHNIIRKFSCRNFKSLTKGTRCLHDDDRIETE